MPITHAATYNANKAALSQAMATIMAEYPKQDLLCLEIGGVQTSFHKKAGAKVNADSLVTLKKNIPKIAYNIEHTIGIKTVLWRWFFIKKFLQNFQSFTIYLLQK